MYGRTPDNRTEHFDTEGRVVASQEIVTLGTGEAMLLQRAVEQSADPEVKGYLAWLAHTIGAVDSMDLEIQITRRWNC